MRTRVRQKLALEANLAMQKVVKNLVELRTEIETHKAKNRVRVLCKSDSDFYRAVEDALDGLQVSRKSIEIIYLYWSMEK